MTSENEGLQADEGVNEGSAEGSTDGMDARPPGVVGGALAAASETGRPKDEYDPAPPLDTGLPQTRSDDGDQVGPGQEQQVGEG